MAGVNPRKPDITGLLRDQLKLAIMTRCNNDDHQRIDQPCAWCDDVCNDLTAYAIARAAEIAAINHNVYAECADDTEDR